MAGQSDRTELLAAILLATFLVVIGTTDATEDLHVSYDVNVNPSVSNQFVIEYEPLANQRYRRQAGGPGNVSAVSPPTSTVLSISSAPDVTPVTSTTNVPSTPAPTTPASTTPDPTTPVATTPAPTSPSPTTTPTTSQPTTTPPITETTSGVTGSTITPSRREDNHQYYSSSIIPDAITDNWVDLTNAKRHKTLSTSHRTAVTINLTFKFRFYGHNVTNITVATGGFIYASPFLHQWLTATQYIAPLMANFDTRIGEASDIYYDDFGDRFAVQWKNVVLKDQNDTGTFDFQVQLHVDGTIKFLYKQLPIKLSAISSQNHPVKIGVSDAFYIDSYLKAQGIRRRTIYEYHRVSFHPDQVEQGTVIIMKPLPTCNIISDCRKCVNHESEQVKFECKWCGSVGRCSDGIDWHRAEWLNSGCSKLAINSTAECEATTPATTTASPTTTTITSTTTTATTSPTTTTIPTTTAPTTTVSTTTTTTTTTTIPSSTSSSNLISSDCGGVSRSSMQTEIDTGCITTSSASNNILDNSPSTNPLENTATIITNMDGKTSTGFASYNATATALGNTADMTTTNTAASYDRISQTDRPSVLGTSTDNRVIHSLTTPSTRIDDENIRYHIVDGNTASRQSDIAGSASSLLEGFLCGVNDFVSLSVVHVKSASVDCLEHTHTLTIQQGGQADRMRIYAYIVSRTH